MKRILFTLISLCISIGTWANGTEINGIYYLLYNSTKTASVTYTGASVPITYPSSYYNPSSTAYKENVIIPSFVTYNGITYIVNSISDYAFSNCTDLTSISIPNSITNISNYAFEDCTGLTSINISDVAAWCNISFGFTESNPLLYAHHLYLNGEEIKDLHIPNTVTTIGDYAFKSCFGLTSVVVPSSVTKIGEDAFANCKGLTSLSVEQGNTIYDSRDGCNAIIITSNNTLIYGCQTTVIPNSVTTIDGYAFQNCTGLTDIVIPNSVTAIGRSAFWGCEGLTNVTLPNGITTIGYSVFGYCSNLSHITIPSSVQNIYNDAFHGCTNLLFIVAEPKNPPFLLSDFPSNVTVFVAPENINRYKSNSSWKNYTLKENSSVISCTQTTLKISVPEYFTNYTIDFDGNSYNAVNNEIIINGLQPYTEYCFNAHGEYKGIEFSGIVTGMTKGIDIYINASSITNTKATVKGSYDAGDATVTETYFNGHEGEGDVITLENLTPGKGVWVTFYVVAEGKLLGNSELVTPKDIIVNCQTIPGPTSCILIGTCDVIDVTVTDISFDGFLGQSSIELHGLQPNTTYSRTLMINTAEGHNRSKDITFSTGLLSITTLQPKVASPGNVVVAAESNITYDNENVGFEWRRNDWTDDYKSNEGTAYLYNGTMEGYIHNLYTEKLWKYRPYYEANDGIRYYGEWVGIDPTNTSYFEPTVHTYANITVNGNSAQVRGYVMRGSDNITQQGFKYWKNTSTARGDMTDIPFDAITVTASGNVMETTLSNLDYETDYCYVAFVNTSEGETYYGEQMIFRTGEDTSGIDGVQQQVKVTEIARYDMSGRRLTKPHYGINIVMMSDGSIQKVIVK